VLLVGDTARPSSQIPALLWRCSPLGRRVWRSARAPDGNAGVFYRARIEGQPFSFASQDNLLFHCLHRFGVPRPERKHPHCTLQLASPVPSLAVLASGPLQAVTVGRRPRSPGCWPPDPGAARRAAHGANHSNRAIRKSRSAVAATTAAANAFPDRGGGGYWGRSLPHACHPGLTMSCNAFEPLTLRRLAKLANTQATRTLLAVAAFQGQKLAEKAAERQKNHWPFASEATRPN